MPDTFDITKLTTKERLDLIGELWDSIAPENVGLTPSQQAELARRMTTFDIDTNGAVPWEDIETELNKRS